MARKAKQPKAERGPRIIRCEETGIEFPYRGYGRPPRYCPEVAKAKAAERRAAAYRARKAAEGKTVKDRKAA